MNLPSSARKEGGNIFPQNLGTQLSECVLQSVMPRVFTAVRISNFTAINLQSQYTDRRVPE